MPAAHASCRCGGGARGAGASRQPDAGDIQVLPALEAVKRGAQLGVGQHVHPQVGGSAHEQGPGVVVGAAWAGMGGWAGTGKGWCQLRCDGGGEGRHGNDCTSACWWMVATRRKHCTEASRVEETRLLQAGGDVQKAAAVPFARGRRSAAAAAVSHLSDGRPTLSIEMTTLLPARRKGCQRVRAAQPPRDTCAAAGRRPPPKGAQAPGPQTCQGQPLAHNVLAGGRGGVQAEQEHRQPRAEGHPALFDRVIGCSEGASAVWRAAYSAAGP